MKTSKCLAIKQESPCPECGNSRVGLDHDDDYYIVPGIVREGCGYRGPSHWTHSHFWQDVYRLAASDAEQPCPDCGNRLEPQVGLCRTWKSEVHAECVSYIESPQHACTRCREHHSHFGYSMMGDD